MPKGGARSPTGVHVRKHSPDLRKPKPRPPHESLDSVGPSRHGAEAIREVDWWDRSRAVNITKPCKPISTIVCAFILAPAAVRRLVLVRVAYRPVTSAPTLYSNPYSQTWDLDYILATGIASRYNVQNRAAARNVPLITVNIVHVGPQVKSSQVKSSQQVKSISS